MAVNPTGTGMVAQGSVLERRKIIKTGLIQQAANSWWGPYKGTTSDSIIYAVNARSPKGGNIVDFDMRGCLESRAIPDTTTAEGRGTQKKLFSDEVTIQTWRFVVDNGTKFRNKAIDHLELGEHSDSISLLADQWVRSVDQGLFDMAQQAPEFGFTLDGTANNTFNITALNRIEAAVKSGYGFDTTPTRYKTRTPLRPFRTQGGSPLYLFIMDTHMKNVFLSDPEIRSLLSSADVRGNNNRLISGVIGKIGNFLMIEAPMFTGTTEGSILMHDNYYDFESTAVLFPGLRKYIKDNQNVYWQGSKKYDAEIANVGQANKDHYARGVILGASAIQFATGKDPEYHFRSYDFGKFSESCLEVWTGIKPARYYAENTDYKSVQFSGYNYGLVNVDVKLN